MSFLKRYQNGEHEQVWSELIALGDAVNSPELHSEAIAVASETMQRVRKNIELLHSRLLAMNYRFIEPEHAFVPPPNDVEEKIAKLENIIGGLPLSIKAWFRHVGGVNFVGSHPKLSSYPARKRFPEWQPYDNYDFPFLTDPLYFCDVDTAIKESVDTRLAINLKKREPDFAVWFTIADYLHKAGYSGDIYMLELPDSHADILLKGEPHNTYFVDYLRQSFNWGGFLGFDLYRNGTFKKSGNSDLDIPYELLKELSKDLLPI